MVAMRNAHNIVAGKAERKRPLGERRRRWDDNIKMVLKETGYGGIDYINLASHRS
jgi:hypothetical protein